MRAGLRPLRDAALATALLLAAVWVGSGRLAHLDHALVGYLGGLVVATFATTWRVSAFWRRRASAPYARALGAGLLRPASALRVLRAAGRDLAAQRFVARRSRTRWVAHLLLSGGTLASIAITVPLVCGWLRFQAIDQHTYQPVVFGVPALPIAVDGVLAWLVFHGLTMAGIAVALGAGWFLGVRLRGGKLHGFHIGPLVLLLVVALTGLALPAASRLGLPGAFRVAALAHQIAVVAMLVGIPFGKLGHVLVRPLQLGARLVRAPGAPAVVCAGCGVAMAPRAQHAAVAAILAARGLATHDRCPACRRRSLAVTQATLQGAAFQPPMLGARPAPRPGRRAA